MHLEELKASQKAELAARRLLEAKLESDLAAKFGISFVRDLKRPDDRQVRGLFDQMMQEHLLDDEAAPRPEAPAASEENEGGGSSGYNPPPPSPDRLAQSRRRLHDLSLDEKWEVLQRHSEATTAAAINYDNPLVVQYRGEAAIADDLGTEWPPLAKAA